jgi:ABC-type sugar transport system substrate-binding protein
MKAVRPLALLCGAAASAALLAACSGSSGSSGSATPTPGGPSSSSAATTAPASFVDYLTSLAPPNFAAPGKRYTIALLDASTVLPQQKSLEVGVQAAAKKYNVSLTVYDAGGFQNVTNQVNQFQTALAQKPDAILVLPASPVALNPEISQARAAGIKVLPMLIPPPSGNYDYAEADDLPLDAAKSVDSLAAATGGKGNLYAIMGGAGSTVAQLFQQGMNAELKKYPGLKVVFTKDLPGYSESDAQSAAESALAAQPDVNGIITNDTILGLGAAEAMKLKGLSNVPIAGIGPGNLAAIKALKSGEITVGATPPFYAVGYTTVQWALAILGGAKPAAKTVTVPPMVLTKDNIASAISTGALYSVLAPSAVGCGPGQSTGC